MTSRPLVPVIFSDSRLPTMVAGSPKHDGGAARSGATRMPTTASFVTYLIPVFGVFLGWLLLNERLGWNSFAGAAMVIAGIAVAEMAVRRVSPRAEPTPPPEAAAAREATAAREAR